MKKLLPILLITFLFSCKKDPIQFTIKGSVEDSTLGGGLANANLSLYSTTAGGGSSVFISSASTDASGNYSFTFERKLVEKYTINIERDNYFDVTSTILFADLNSDEDNTRNFSTTAEAFVQFNLLNSGVVNDDDQLKIQKLSGKTDCEDCCPLGISYYNGAVDQSITCPNDGNTLYKFIYWLPGQNTANYDSVYTTPFNTVEFNITY